jgi:hypothetical protein
LAHALLLSGKFREGWKEYEWRWKVKGMLFCRDFSQPVWNGSSLQGKTLFVYDEQGVGDEIMFASCLPEVIAQSNLCVVETDKRLVPLFSRSFPNALVIDLLARNKAYPSELPQADMKTAIGSLPQFLRPDFLSFSKQQTYLIPDTPQVNIWHKRFEVLGEGPKIGISWRGGKSADIRRIRSTVLEQWDKLFSIHDVHFINLQYGDCTQELREAREAFEVIIHDWEDVDPLKDLDWFAAQISALDLVISVDNATVHMAGALGVKVWTLLPFVPDWRWVLNREDSPWYPTMRLFRQPSPGDWESVMVKVANELHNFKHCSRLEQAQE